MSIITFLVHYEGIETYINSKTYFFGQHGGSPIEIDAGSHRYNFVFRLPPKLPYSVHFNKGSITYHAEVVLDIPWHFDKNIKVPFTIIRNDDLNLITQLRVPLTSIKDATFFTFFHESKPLHMTVFIPYSGYTINQNVPIRVTYNNESNVDVLKTAVSLKQIVTFSCHTPNEDTKVKEYRLLEIHASGVKAHEANDFCVALRIPTTAVNSNGMFCKVINIRYVIEVTADVSGLHSNIHNEIPIVIGSLPIDFENEFSAIQIQSNVTQESFDDLRKYSFKSVVPNLDSGTIFFW